MKQNLSNVASTRIQSFLLIVLLAATWTVRAWSQPIAFIFLGIITILVFIRAPKMWSFPRVGVPLVIVSFASTVWAVSAERALLEAMATFLIIFTGYTVGYHLSAGNIIVVLRRACFIVAAISLFLYYTHPRLVTSIIDSGVLIGPATQKNVFAYVILLGFGATLFSNWTVKTCFIRIVQLSTLAATLILAESATNITLAGTLVIIRGAVAVSMKGKSWSNFVSAVMWFIAASAVLFGWLFVEIVLGMLGRDMTFTGRTTIWQNGLILWRDRPIFGYGGGFFYVFSDPSLSFGYEASQVVYEMSIGWALDIMHSGFLEAAIYYGIIGVVVFSIMVITFVIRSIKVFCNAPTLVTGWLLAIGLTLPVTLALENAFRTPRFAMLAIGLGCCAAAMPPRNKASLDDRKQFDGPLVAMEPC